ATTDGVRRLPSWLAMTFTSPPSITATTLLVVPRSIPIIFSPSATMVLLLGRRAGFRAQRPGRRVGQRAPNGPRARCAPAGHRVAPRLVQDEFARSMPKSRARANRTRNTLVELILRKIFAVAVGPEQPGTLPDWQCRRRG